MQVDVDPSFPYPALFIVAGRAAGSQAPPAEPVGVLIVKQTVLVDGTIGEQQPILTDDEGFENDLRDAEDLTLRVESDLIPYKPWLDVAAVHDDWLQLSNYGSARVNLGGGIGPWFNLPYFWRDRLDEPRLSEAGGKDNLENFQPAEIDPFNPPPLEEIYALPTGFRNSYFNGSPLNNLPLLNAGDSVDFNNTSTTKRVTIPAGPSVTIDNAPPLTIEQNVDTIVWDESNRYFLITWRTVFRWEDALNNATMEVA